MGQSMKKFVPDAAVEPEESEEEIAATIAECYDKYFSDSKKIWSSDEFYDAVRDTVKEINHESRRTQFIKAFMEAAKKHQQREKRSLTRVETKRLVTKVITKEEDQFTPWYILVVPAAALFIKNRLMPQAISDEFFIPGVTSVTVLTLAMLGKI